MRKAGKVATLWAAMRGDNLIPESLSAIRADAVPFAYNMLGKLAPGHRLARVEIRELPKPKRKRAPKRDGER